MSEKLYLGGRRRLRGRYGWLDNLSASRSVATAICVLLALGAIAFASFHLIGVKRSVASTTAAQPHSSSENPTDILNLPMSEQTSFAMGTYVHLQLYGAKADQAVQASLRELERLEQVFNRFQPGSELSRLNAQAGNGWVSISSDMVNVLRVALDIAAKSQGAYDPTIAPLVDLWGFQEKDGQIPAHAPPDDAAIRNTLRRVDYRQVTLDSAGRRVKLARQTQIDLGGVAKGYALDCLAAVAAKYGVQHGMIDLGGNIRVLGEKAPGKPWRIAVRHPRNIQDIFAVIPVRDKNVATSGDYQRFFIWRGRRYAHILDPRTGQPAQEVISVTILAPTGALSDALSTAAYVLGPQRGKALIDGIAECAGVFVDAKMHMTTTRGLNGLVQRAR